MTYLPGEKIRVTVDAKVDKVVDCDGGNPWSALCLNVEDGGGSVALRIPIGWVSVQIERVTPAGGRPSLGQVWQDCRRSLWWVTYDPTGVLRFMDGHGNFTRIDDLNKNYGPLIRVYPPAADEPSVDEEVPW